MAAGLGLTRQGALARARRENKTLGDNATPLYGGYE
jgi:hypothetical protein